ncbi:MAG: PPC domain-containing protein, partial [Candidatus Lokiarchaeota archaeon]|nr:PPC domain-containing protein [Candidatus Lokiarchaeota archaeon]
MRFNKKYKRGLFLLILLLLITTSISFITFKPKNNISNENSVSLSATEDFYEPNNNYTTAFDLTNYYSMWLSSIDGLGAQHDDDWYQIDVAPEFGHLIIECSFSNMSGNIDMDLYDGSDPFNPVATSWTENDDEYIYYNLPWSGIYYIKIHGLNNTNNYDLRWRGDDIYEENDDFWNSRWVNPNFYPNLKIIDYDEDWFHIYLNSGDTIDVSIFFNHDDGNLELELFDPDYNYTIGSYSSNSSNYEEKFLYTAGVSGDWRIRVYRISGSIDVSYDLDIWLNVGDDWMEENDEYWGAHWVDAKYYPDLMIMGDDEDWFRTYLNSDDAIDINIYFDNYQGNLELEFYDPNDSNNLRDGSYSDTNNEFISFTADVSGDWRFRIYHADGNSNVQYNLEIRINGMIGGDDPYEYNNDFYEAYDLHDDERRWLSNIHGLAVQGDDDWYRIDVTPGFQNLIVNLKFDRSRGNINVDIYKLEGMHSTTWITSNYSMTGDDRIDINCSHIDPGIYMIQVRGDYSGLEYNLWWDDERTDNRLDDNYEENDDLMSAYDLSFHQSEPLWRINGTALQKDNDWYRIYVESGF